MDRIKNFNSKYTKKTPDVKPGDTVRVHTKIREGNKERVQVFEGVAIKRQGGSGIGATVTVRKISYGIGVERRFMLHSPLIEKIVVTKRAQVRRANIGYLRNLTGKSAKLKEKQFDALAVNVKEEDLSPADKAEIEKEVNAEEPVVVSEDVLSQPETESIDAVVKAEDKEALAEDTDSPVEDEQKDPQEEIAEGVEEAEEDIEKGKAGEGEKAEKTKEDETGKEQAEEEKGTGEGQS